MHSFDEALSLMWYLWSGRALLTGFHILVQLPAMSRASQRLLH